MSDSEAIQKTNGDGVPPRQTSPGLTTISVSELTGRLEKIKQARSGAMKEGTHYGEIPGVDKQTLLKPGAEILSTLFQFDPQPEVDVIDLGGEHREYRVTGSLYHIPTGNRVGGGVGSCSTKEKKYRYRYIDEMTEVPIPGEFWDSYDKSQGENMGDADFGILEEELMKAGVDIPDGGEAGVTKNDDGEWRITIKAKGENPDIADTYNTCLKMAKKRWLVDAVLTATAASEMFTQDVEDMPDMPDPREDSSGKGNREPQPSQPSPAQNGSGSGSEVNRVERYGHALTQKQAKDLDWWDSKLKDTDELAVGIMHLEEQVEEKLDSDHLISAYETMLEKHRKRLNESGGPENPWPEDSGKEQGGDGSGSGEASQKSSQGDPQKKSSAQSDRKHDGLQDAISHLMPNALEQGQGQPVQEKYRISEKQRKRMYAIAKDNEWKDSWLDRLVKDELGYESKNHVPYGDPYDQICEALEDQELKHWISRDPDTPDMFEGSEGEGGSDPFEDEGLPEEYPQSFPHAEKLKAAGIQSPYQLKQQLEGGLSLEDEIEGIGGARAQKIKNRLELINDDGQLPF